MFLIINILLYNSSTTLKAEFLQATANPKSDPKLQTQGVSLIKSEMPLCHSAHRFHLEVLISQLLGHLERMAADI